MDNKINAENDQEMENLSDLIINADDNAAGTTHLNEVVEESGDVQKITELENALTEQKDKYMRLMAEFENYKRRTAKERREIEQTGGKDIVILLLDVLDDCERAEKQLTVSKDIAQIKEGVLLVFNKFRAVLQAKGVKQMDDNIGADFDLEKQEAITEIPAPTEELKGKVIDEVQKGYYLNDKIIRFAKVVVGK
ncbi:MAG: nucleotide exchange factor GrpE [Chitinophagaceae bacterium]|jgi:molecular chaperone GrpE|nr:nucleotide exchange factor GrpE [Chitinophagaceae bacterium]